MVGVGRFSGLKKDISWAFKKHVPVLNGQWSEIKSKPFRKKLSIYKFKHKKKLSNKKLAADRALKICLLGILTLWKIKGQYPFEGQYLI